MKHQRFSLCHNRAPEGRVNIDAWDTRTPKPINFLDHEAFGTLVWQMDDDRKMGRPSLLCEERARFLVHAANVHYEMLGALWDAICIPNIPADVRAKLRAALINADGRP